MEVKIEMSAFYIDTSSGSTACRGLDRILDPKEGRYGVDNISRKTCFYLTYVCIILINNNDKLVKVFCRYGFGPTVSKH